MNLLPIHPMDKSNTAPITQERFPRRGTHDPYMGFMKSLLGASNRNGKMWKIPLSEQTSSATRVKILTST